jgi:ribosomal protein L5
MGPIARRKITEQQRKKMSNNGVNRPTLKIAIINMVRNSKENTNEIKQKHKKLNKCLGLEYAKYEVRNSKNEFKIVGGGGEGERGRKRRKRSEDLKT